MKKILIAIITVSTFAACNNGKSNLETSKDVVLTDTTGMYRSNMYTDTGSMIITQPVSRVGEDAGSVVPRTNTVSNRSTTTNRNRTRTNRSTSTASTGNNTQSTSTGQTTTTRKRGWSKAAKDATIGGVGGAITGAIISKNKVKGAVIGGVLGAAGGYIIGRSKDKKEGR